MFEFMVVILKRRDMAIPDFQTLMLRHYGNY